MYRQQYQDKYIIRDKIKRQEDIQKLEDEVKDVFYLFEELKNENSKQSSSFTHISDLIEESKNKIDISEQDVVIAKEEASILSSIKGGLVGAGLGSLMFIYSPYIAIGTTIGGFISGYSIPYLTDYYSKNEK